MDTFEALADPTRRAILEMLAQRGQLAASEIYERFTVSPQAVSQHLKVLREAQLVVMEKRAQKHLYRLNPQALDHFATWVESMKHQWEERFATLDQVLAREQEKMTRSEQESE